MPLPGNVYKVYLMIYTRTHDPELDKHLNTVKPFDFK